MKILFVWINGRLDLDNMIPLASRLEQSAYSCRIVDYDTAMFNTNPDDYNAIVVGHDWSDYVKNLFTKFNKCVTIVLQHEGLYIDEEKWYDSKCPISDVVLCWGKRHKTLFKNRGYKKELHCVGPIRWDIYKDYKPKTILPDTNMLVFAAQQFDLQGNIEYLHSRQKHIIEYICNLDWDGEKIIKIHPQYDSNYKLGFDYYELTNEYKDVKVVSNEIDIHDLMFYASQWVTESSTTAIERAFFNKPSIILFEGKHPIFDLCGFERFTLESLKRIKSNPSSSIQQEGLEVFLSNFTKGLDGNSCERAFQAINGYFDWY